MARARVRAVDLALGVAGVAGAAALVISYLGSGRTPFIILGGMLVAMVLLLVIARLYSARPNPAITMAGAAIVWSVVLFFVTFLVLTVTAFVWHLPRGWATFIGADEEIVQSICFAIKQLRAFSCQDENGIYVISNIRWDDKDRGLVVHKTPELRGPAAGVIPSNGTNVSVGVCEEEWCPIECRKLSLKGWARSRFLNLRSSVLKVVKGIQQNDPHGLIVRSGPDSSCEEIGTIPRDARDVVAHICEPSPIDSQLIWCRVTYNNFVSGWVKGQNLDDQE